MLDILAITGPIYLTIALGYFLTRRGLFARADMRVLGQFVINLALPALLFNALAQRKLADILNGRYLLIYALGSLAAMGLGLHQYTDAQWERMEAAVQPPADLFSPPQQIQVKTGSGAYAESASSYQNKSV